MKRALIDHSQYPKTHVHPIPLGRPIVIWRKLLAHVCLIPFYVISVPILIAFFPFVIWDWATSVIQDD